MSVQLGLLFEQSEHDEANLDCMMLFLNEVFSSLV
jgi:hypothetical protein